MGNNYSGGYGTPDGLGGYGKCLVTLIQFVLVPLCGAELKFILLFFFLKKIHIYLFGYAGLY